MNLNNLSAKKICRLISAGMVFSMLVITGILGGIMQDIRIFIVGGTLTLCAFFWIWLLVLIFGKRLSHFTSNLCRTLDNMIDGNEELQKSNDSETLFARINHRLIRLYEIMQKNRHKVDMERQELQMLISDISHQVKTPVSNLQMVTDTLLTKPVSEEERMDFLQGIRSQTDKLDFLFQALVNVPVGNRSNTIRKERQQLIPYACTSHEQYCICRREKRNCCIRGLPGKFDNLP